MESHIGVNTISGINGSQVYQLCWVSGQVLGLNVSTVLGDIGVVNTISGLS